MNPDLQTFRIVAGLAMLAALGIGALAVACIRDARRVNEIDWEGWQ